MKTRRTETHLTPAALVSHTMIRIQGEQEGDIAVFHACSPNARLRLQWGGILMTMLSAQACQGVLEGFSAARSAMTLIPRLIPTPPPAAADPFALPTVAIDWTRRPAYAVVPRQELRFQTFRFYATLPIASLQRFGEVLAVAWISFHGF